MKRLVVAFTVVMALVGGVWAQISKTQQHKAMPDLIAIKVDGSITMGYMEYRLRDIRITLPLKTIVETIKQTMEQPSTYMVECQQCGALSQVTVQGQTVLSNEPIVVVPEETVYPIKPILEGNPNVEDTTPK